MKAKQKKPTTLSHIVDWCRPVFWLTALAVALVILLAPNQLHAWLAGFVNSMLLALLLRLFVPVYRIVALLVAGIVVVYALRRGRKKRAVLWLSVAAAVVLGHALLSIAIARPFRESFARGQLARLEVRTDIQAVRTWLASVDPNDCLPPPHTGSRGRYLSEQARPAVLRHAGGFLYLELDAESRPSVRLARDQSKAGRFGLVIGAEDMKTPPSEPGTYGQKRTELRPGVYFWYEEA